MSNSESFGPRRALLFVRSDLPEPSQHRRTELEAGLRELVCAGVLDDARTVVWDKRVRAHGRPETVERNRYQEFAEWATQAHVSLAPFFDTRECYSATTGEKETQLVMPTMCLAIYEDDDLVHVAPHANGGSTESVTECVESLESPAGRPVPNRSTVSTAD